MGPTVPLLQLSALARTRIHVPDVAGSWDGRLRNMVHKVCVYFLYHIRERFWGKTPISNRQLQVQLPAGPALLKGFVSRVA